MILNWLYKGLLRPVLFAQKAEDIHERTMHMLGWVSRHPMACGAMASLLGSPELPVEAFGLKFPNPVGLAAGMDKRAEAVPAWAAMGFGHSELGGVTQHAQPGNPLPRVFRAIQEEAIINRMGFNNPGAEALAKTLTDWRAMGRWPRHPVGINLGKSKITPLDQAAGDYVHSFRALHTLADFFVVNVSSPNTPNLRQLQDKAALDEILAALQTAQHPKAIKPILVKVAPDLSFEALDEIVEVATHRKLDGLVAANTTITRPTTSDHAAQRVYSETGGLSGRPLRARNTEVIRHLYRQTRGAMPIIGVGGVFNADDAWEKITAGASLVQIYTGLVYEGPGIAKSIVKGLRNRLSLEGMNHLRDAVGTSAR